MKILLVEDDFDVARNVCDYLEADGDTVEWAPDGLIGLDCATRDSFDAIVLDIGVPRLSGRELCQRLRGLGLRQVPIMMLTARSEVSDKVDAFERGADDYLVKPFALAELRSRLKALVRRASGSAQDAVLRAGDLEFDTATLRVRRGAQVLHLTATCRRILEVLLRNSHRVVPRPEIERAVWGDDLPQSDSLKIHIHLLREAIDRPYGSHLLQTVRGAGYRLCADDDLR